MLLTDKAKAILMIVLEVLFTIGLIAGSVYIAVSAPDIKIEIVSLVYMLTLIAFMGVIIGFTVFTFIDEL